MVAFKQPPFSTLKPSFKIILPDLRSTVSFVFTFTSTDEESITSVSINWLLS